MMFFKIKKSGKTLTKLCRDFNFENFQNAITSDSVFKKFMIVILFLQTEMLLEKLHHRLTFKKQKKLLPFSTSLSFHSGFICLHSCQKMNLMIYRCQNDA